MQLRGHSGCNLSLIEYMGTYCVKKSAQNIKYNKRLKEQCLKQSRYLSPVFQSVPVCDYGYDRDGHFYFIMDYIPGETLAEHMRTIPLNEIGELSDIFFNSIPEVQAYDKNAREFFVPKVNNLFANVEHDDPEMKEIFLYLLKYKWPYMVHSECHGDFTLENMLYYQNKIYLLDFLDSFYDSWIIDFAKIFQDIDIFWHYRRDRYIDNNLYLRLLILKESLVQRILSLPNGEELMESIYHALLVNILRIFPYTKDRLTIDYLHRKLHYVYKRIRNYNWR